MAGKAARGAIALGARHLVVTAVNVAGGVLLARYLTPSEFGVYAIVAFAMALLTSFGDAGLGASLIRQEQPPTERDYASVFLVQQLVVLAVVVLAWLGAPLVTRLYGFDAEYAWLVRLLALALGISTFQVIPAIRLERELKFGRLGGVNAVEAVTFNVVAVAAAALNLGAFSFGAAAVVSAIVGAALMNVASPWRPRWVWDTSGMRPRLSFGIAYQGIGFVSFVKDSITPLLVGLYLGSTEVGYVKWAQSFAAYIVIALLVLDRVYLPAFARLQSRERDLKNFAEAVVHATNALVAPIAVLTLVFADDIVRDIYGAKWSPALPIFWWLWAANVVVPTASPLFSLLNATGRSRTALSFAVVWMVGTWVLGAPLIVAFGAVGFGVANALVQLTNVLLFRKVKQIVSIEILRNVWAPWACAAAVGLIGVAVRSRLAGGGVALALVLACGCAIYAVVLATVDRSAVSRLVRVLRRARA